MTDFRMGRERAKQVESPLTPGEHRALRGLNGQIQWACRMVTYEVAFAASKLAGAMAKPVIADLKEANRVVRTLRRQGDRFRLVYNSGMGCKGLATLAAHDASFDNMPNHKSQRGFFLMVCDKGMIEDHTKLHKCHVVAWSSGRIHRVVRSTLGRGV